MFIDIDVRASAGADQKDKLTQFISGLSTDRPISKSYVNDTSRSASSSDSKDDEESSSWIDKLIEEADYYRERLWKEQPQLMQAFYEELHTTTNPTTQQTNQHTDTITTS
jgi:hypothetical protein